jgi:phosphatidylethanolamine/phosphatidyl-N-methylethanolamine N-methyltransferase
MATITNIYARLAPVYDLIYGLILHPGRRTAVARMNLSPGMRVLEIGAGTGLSAMLYPPDCEVVAIDVSVEMLRRAETRLARRGVKNVQLQLGDATALRFDDASFDLVYAPYLINVVPDPIAVVREMRRVCRPTGRIVLLNHFRSQRKAGAWKDDVIDRHVMSKVGVRWNVPLRPLIDAANLEVLSSAKVNVPRFSSLVECRRQEAGSAKRGSRAPDRADCERVQADWKPDQVDWK